MPPIKPARFARARRDAAVSTIRSACSRFKAKMNSLDTPYFGKKGLAGLLGEDAERLEEVLAFMEKNGWARKTGYKETYEIF